MARLNETKRHELYELIRNSGDYFVRQKARVILAWNRKIKIVEIARMYEQTNDMIEIWIDAYKSLGIAAILKK